VIKSLSVVEQGMTVEPTGIQSRERSKALVAGEYDGHEEERSRLRIRLSGRCGRTALRLVLGRQHREGGRGDHRDPGGRGSNSDAAAAKSSRAASTALAEVPRGGEPKNTVVSL
jgi:hypothetical protein